MFLETPFNLLDSTLPPEDPKDVYSVYPCKSVCTIYIYIYQYHGM